MKVSREQVSKNRENILASAARLFRDKGYDAVTLADVMKDAGLTHGGFYGYFSSKGDLMAQANAWQSDKQLAGISGELADYVAGYLDAAHVANRAGGCLFAALGSDAPRQSGAARHAMSQGLQGMIARLGELMGDGAGDAEARRDAAMTLFSTMVGGLLLARLVDDDDAAARLLAANRAALLAGLATFG
jgi:TetR/AcrR family transcriptional repressor of nem operon